MPTITFLPTQQTVTVQAGATVLDAALDGDVPLQHACGGFCACTTCHIRVKSGADQLSPIEDEEQERLESTADDVTAESRLGCQAKILGDVTVEMVLS